MDLNTILVWAFKSVLLFFIIITACAYYTLAERVVSAFIQDRRGPNRAGPLGLLQPLADGIKFLTKEEVFPTQVNKVTYLIAPAISVSCAIMSWAIIPFGGAIPLPDSISSLVGFKELQLQLANPDTGILFFAGHFIPIGLRGYSGGMEFQ